MHSGEEEPKHCSTCYIGVCPAQRWETERQPRYCANHMTRQEDESYRRRLEEKRWNNYKTESEESK